MSEALLYKHFAGKEALYEALKSHRVEAHAVGTRLFDAAPHATATLVKGVAVLVQGSATSRLTRTPSVLSRPACLATAG